MFKERLLELLNDKESYTKNDYYRLSRSIAKLFLEDEEAAILFLKNDCTDDDLYNISEFFDEILRLTIHDNIYKAFKDRYRLMLDNTDEEAIKKAKVYESLKYSWI